MSTDQARAYLVGGGIASLSAAVLLIRDGGFRGPNIRIIEELPVAGGALDGSGNPVKGYVTRGGRMFTEGDLRLSVERVAERAAPRRSREVRRGAAVGLFARG